MDFLDPRKKKTRTIRLMTGYVLMAIAIGLATVILVYGAYGYGIDTKTGEITENGILFVDSKPGSANIYLNKADEKKTTSARMILNAGQYELLLKKDGYRDWKRSFTLDEHSIKRYVYPFLFPEKLNPIVLKNYPSQPGLTTTSPDRRFLLVQNQSTARGLSFDMYDTGETEKPAVPVDLPVTLLTAYNPLVSKIVEIEWANDNTHLLVQHISAAANEFIIIDRTNPTDSVNINKQLNLNPTQVMLRDKKINELYVYDQPSRTLRLANVNQKQLEPPIINDVYAFKTYGRNLISYVTSTGATVGKMNSRIWDNGKSYPLNVINIGNKYHLDIAEFQGDWYYVGASDKDNRVSIYKNPLDIVKNSKVRFAPPMVAFDIASPSKISFSSNTRFLNIQSGQKFGVYDFEVNEQYQYEVALPLTEPMVWMDGHRLMGVSGGNTVIMDYDSLNQQTLTPSQVAKGGYFSRDYNQFYTLTPAAEAGVTSLIRVDMRTGDDLPEELR